MTKKNHNDNSRAIHKISTNWWAPFVLVIMVTGITYFWVVYSEEISPDLSIHLQEEKTDLLTVNNVGILKKELLHPSLNEDAIHLAFDMGERAARIRAYTAMCSLSIAVLVSFCLSILVLSQQKTFPKTLRYWIITIFLLGTLGVAGFRTTKKNIMSVPTAIHATMLRATGFDDSPIKNIWKDAARIHSAPIIAGIFSALVMASLLRGFTASDPLLLRKVAQRLRMLNMLMYGLAFLFVTGLFTIMMYHDWVAGFLDADTQQVRELFRAASLRSAINYFMIICSIYIPCMILLTRVAYKSISSDMSEFEVRNKLVETGLKPSPLEAGIHAFALFSPLFSWLLEGAIKNSI